MIAAVDGWHAAAAALLLRGLLGAVLVPVPPAAAAEDLNGAARELARRTAEFAGRGEGLAVEWRNVSSMSRPEAARAHEAFEAALREAGCVVNGPAAGAEARLTLSENQSDYLLVEEARKGGERQVWIASWKRGGAAAGAAGIPLSLEKKLVWEQPEQILDIAFPPGGMLVLSPSKIESFAHQNGRWELQATAPITPDKPWPRDLRGRLRVNGTDLHAALPGLACSGAAAPALSLQCHAADEPWVIASGSMWMLLANFAPARNYFDGRVTTQTGLRKTVPPFYSAAAVDEHGRVFWLLAMLDGRVQVFDPAMEPVGTAGAWGSDLAGIDAVCGGAQVLATRAGDADEPDALQAYATVNGAPAAMGAALDFPGPVTALWAAGGKSVLVVVRKLTTGTYAAYLVTAGCS